VDNLTFSKAQLLLKIFSQKNEDLNIQLHNALEWSTEALGMELGIISHIQNETYTIKKFWPQSDALEAEQKFDLKNTYCSLAIEKDDVFSVNYMGESEYKEHDCYKTFQLESYIGRPFHLDGSLYGTVNFSSSQPKITAFSEDDNMFVRLLSGWVTSTIHRINIEEQLKEEHRLYKIISTNSAEMICIHELDGTYTFISPSVKNLLGYSPRELIGQNPYRLFHPDDLERISEESHKSALKGNSYPSVEYRIKKKNGTYIWFDTATEPVTNEEGEVIALQTTSREVSERKRLELLFRQAQKMNNVGGWQFNLQTDELFWTEEVYNIYELDPTEKITFEQALSYYPMQSRKKVKHAMKKAIENGETYDLELPFNTAKDNSIWIRLIVKAEFLGMEAVELYGSFQDITAKKRIEELFRDSQKMASVGGWEYELDSGKLYWTDEVYRIHELPIGTKVFVEDGLSYYPEGGPREQLQAALDHTIATGEEYDLELPFITAKKNNIWVRAIGHAELVDGKAVKLRGAFQNITEKKLNEEKIKSQLEQLSQLKTTREKLYAIIAHDLRNSIFGITGLLELILDEAKANEIDIEDLFYKLSLIQMSADYSYKLLENMLTWVKLQSGMLELRPHAFNIHTTLDTSLDLLRPALDSKKITINQIVEVESHIIGDPNLISTILRNVINNAIKFSEPEGNIDIKIEDQSEDNISISIKDHGIGMDDKTIKNLFNSEIRPQTEGTMREKGSGLGLILVKELAELHHSHVKVNSELGNGSEFTITIPKEFNSY